MAVKSGAMDGPCTMKPAQFRSTAVTCLIRPPRVSSLAVVRCRACSSVRSRVVNRRKCLALASVASTSARSPVRVVVVPPEVPEVPEVMSCRLSRIDFDEELPDRTYVRSHCGQFLSAMTGTIETMANTSSRALRLLSLLQNHRFWSGPELAERLGVSSRTLRRDVDRLRELGYPVTAHPGVDGGYQLASGTALPPLVVDDEEAVALAVGLRLATQGATGPGSTDQDSPEHGTIAEAAARALAKVTQVMPARLRRRTEAVAAMTESATWDAARAARVAAINPDVLASAALACRDAERIRFPYGAANGERTERHVEPHRLVALDRHWYLV